LHGTDTAEPFRQAILVRLGEMVEGSAVTVVPLRVHAGVIVMLHFHVLLGRVYPQQPTVV